tara:strand:- start:5600 stop:6574 length:975 start_codon:yes stop_codon:yes gene_type:complete
MSRSIGNDARVGKYFIAPQLGTPAEPCPKIHNSRDFLTGVDSSGNYIIRDETQTTDRIKIDKTTGVITFTPPLPAGSAGVENPMVVDLDGGAFDITNLDSIYTNNLFKVGGTAITLHSDIDCLTTNTLKNVPNPTAGLDVANKQYVDSLAVPYPGMYLSSVNTAPSGPDITSGDLTSWGLLGEIGKWKIVMPNIKTSGIVGLTFWMTRPGGAYLAGDVNGIDYSAGGFIPQGPVSHPTQPIILCEAGDAITPGEDCQLEIDIIQKENMRGTCAISFTYFNSTGRFRKTLRNFQTGPAGNMAGFYIRPGGASTLQGTIYTYRYHN